LPTPPFWLATAMTRGVKRPSVVRTGSAWPDPAPTTPLPCEAMEAAPATILIVEPEGKVAGAVASRLESDGHRVDWVPTVREARGRLREEPTDVLLLDVVEPATTLEFFQAVRFAPEAPRGGIVVITDPEDQRTRELAQQLGAAAVVTRPVHADEVSAVVRDLVRHL